MRAEQAAAWRHDETRHRRDEAAFAAFQTLLRQLKPNSVARIAKG